MTRYPIQKKITPAGGHALHCGIRQGEIDIDITDASTSSEFYRVVTVI